ncbi:MAG: hypothetical protein JWM71_1325 [Solirubrobacteraceae bacterium]|nr:hypothetical protein [Solirubrobacteraceae bacterium]
MPSVLDAASEDRTRAARFGGVPGNEALTSAAAAVLIVLLAAEGVTIIDLGGLRTPHMFIGVLLIPPVLVKLASTGYRFARYYTHEPRFRDKGPPALGLRLLAPLLVAATVTVFATGVALLIEGHKTGTLMQLHKLSFIVWGVCFAVHLLAHIPRMVRSLGSDWSRRRRRELSGAGARAAVLGVSIAGGLVAALALLSTITGWHPDQPFR